MQRPVFPAMKGLDGLRSTRGSAAGRGLTVSNSKAESSMGSFVSLKIAAERLVKEQAAVKIDLDMAAFKICQNSKLKKAMEQIHALEEKVKDANNENAKLNVKQKEDIKVWNGLESKLTATKALCDKLMDTLQLLSTQTNEAEMDKKFFEEKLLENSKIFDAFKSQIDVISEKLEHAEESIRKGKQELAEVRKEREEIVSSLREQLHAFENINKGKDDAIMHLKDNIEENKVQMQGLDSLLNGLQEELKSKEGQCNILEADVANLVKEKTALQSANDHISRKMSDSSKEIAHLQSIIQDLVLKIEEIDKNSMSAVDDLTRLLSTIENHKTQVQQKEGLVAKLSRMKLNQLQMRCADTSSENEALRAEIGVFKGRIHELEKDQEFSMVQHAEECRLAEDKVQVLEAKVLELKREKNELEALQAKLEDNIKHLTNTLSMTENNMQDLITKISGLEHENADLHERMQTMILEKTKKIEALEGLILEHEAQFSSLGNQINELQNILNDKEQANIQYMKKHKLLEEQLAETQSSLAAAESTLAEARRQYDLMLEGKQTELSKHLREISQKNDQAINDIRRKFDVEKSEIINAEKEKMEIFIKDAERKCEEKVEESKEEAKKSLAHIHEEHATLVLDDGLRPDSVVEETKILFECSKPFLDKLGGISKFTNLQVGRFSFMIELSIDDPPPPPGLEWPRIVTLPELDERPTDAGFPTLAVDLPRHPLTGRASGGGATRRLVGTSRQPNPMSGTFFLHGDVFNNLIFSSSEGRYASSTSTFPGRITITDSMPGMLGNSSIDSDPFRSFSSTTHSHVFRSFTNSDGLLNLTTQAHPITSQEISPHPKPFSPGEPQEATSSRLMLPSSRSSMVMENRDESAAWFDCSPSIEVAAGLSDRRSGKRYRRRPRARSSLLESALKSNVAVAAGVASLQGAFEASK